MKRNSYHTKIEKNIWANKNDKGRGRAIESGSVCGGKGKVEKPRKEEPKKPTKKNQLKKLNILTT